MSSIKTFAEFLEVYCGKPDRCYAHNSDAMRAYLNMQIELAKYHAKCKGFATENEGLLDFTKRYSERVSLVFASLTHPDEVDLVEKTLTNHDHYQRNLEARLKAESAQVQDIWSQHANDCAIRAKSCGINWDLRGDSILYARNIHIRSLYETIVSTPSQRYSFKYGEAA